MNSGEICFNNFKICNKTKLVINEVLSLIFPPIVLLTMEPRGTSLLFGFWFWYPNSFPKIHYNFEITYTSLIPFLSVNRVWTWNMLSFLDIYYMLYKSKFMCQSICILLVCFNRPKYYIFEGKFELVLQKLKVGNIKACCFDTCGWGWVQISTVVASFIGVRDRTISFIVFVKEEKEYFKLFIHHNTNTWTCTQHTQTLCARK